MAKSALTEETKQKRALAILNEAKSGGLLKKEIPEDDATRLKLANYVIDDARARKEKGEAGPHITNILFTADVDWTEDEDERRFKEYINEELESGLPVPPEVKSEVPEMPLDLTLLSLTELRRLHGAFNACSARAGWLYAYEETATAAAKLIADHYEEEFIATADRKDHGGKAKAMKLLQIEAEKANPKITKWRERENHHARRANRYKRLLDSYNLNCDRLSRDFTMRTEEQR